MSRKERSGRDEAMPDGEGAPEGAGRDGDVKGEAETPEGLDALTEKDRECADLLDRLQRKTAELLNFQSRVDKRTGEAVWAARRDLVVDLLPVIDNFERALAAAETQADPDAFHEGVQLVHDQLLAALEKQGVERIEADGREFDPEHHEAVAHVPSGEHPANHVIDVTQAGYRLDGRTVRPSRVAVSSGPADAAGDEVPGGGAAEDADTNEE